jgi:lipopolysaccharide transport system permease protein
MPPSPSAPPLVIRSQAGWRISLGLGELWRYRDLVALLALRDLKVRYKQSVLGAGWAVLQPLLTLGVFAGIFGLRWPGPPPGARQLHALSTFCAGSVAAFARGVAAGGEASS